MHIYTVYIYIYTYIYAYIYAYIYIYASIFIYSRYPFMHLSIYLSINTWALFIYFFICCYATLSLTVWIWRSLSVQLFVFMLQPLSNMHQMLAFLQSCKPVHCTHFIFFSAKQSRAAPPTPVTSAVLLSRSRRRSWMGEAGLTAAEVVQGLLIGSASLPPFLSLLLRAATFIHLYIVHLQKGQRWRLCFLFSVSDHTILCQHWTLTLQACRWC